MGGNPVDMANEVFPAGPDRIALYTTAGQQHVLAALLQDVAAGLHLLCLSGPEGSGKTTLLRAVRKNLQRGLVGVIEKPVQSGMLFEAAKAFQLDIQDANESILRRRLVMHLSMADRQHQPIVLIVDAVESLTTEDFDLLLHFFPPGHASLILAGSTVPETWPIEYAHAADAVRIDRSYQLEPLSEEETAGYVRHRLRMAGLPDDLFPPATLATIHRKSGGIPGRINQFSADVLAHSGVRRGVQGDSSSVPEAAPETGMGGSALPPAVTDIFTADATTTETVRERRRSAEVRARPVVAPREARYASEHLSSRTRKLRRSARVWRALAIVAVVVLALDLARDAWRDYLPVDLAVIERISRPILRPAEPEPPAQEPVRPGVEDEPADPAASAHDSGTSSDFAALHAPSLRHDVPQRSGTTPSDPATSVPPAPPVHDPAPEPPVDASEPGAETARGDTDINRAESAPETAREPDSVPPDVRPRDNTAKADREAVRGSSGSDAAQQESPRLTSSERQEVGRLYAERAEYEWRNGELAAAAVSIQRGLSSDPTNPRLLHMRNMLRQLVEDR